MPEIRLDLIKLIEQTAPQVFGAVDPLLDIDIRKERKQL